MSSPAYDAVVLAGGASRRLGGRDKAAQLVGGATLLDRVLAAVPDAVRTVVVGPFRPVTATVNAWTQESPPGGGPVAGLAAGLAETSAATVVVLAADLPFVSMETIRSLLAAALGADGALLLDADGRDQPLVSAWRAAALRDAVHRLPTPVDVSLHRLVADLDVRRVALSPAAGAPPPWLDCDTEAELRLARELA
jgi:molybdopterin-guanine dinucleotide biosynthesis protein A